VIEGVFEKNRGFIGKLLHIKTDYIFKGGLDGNIVSAESIRREGFMGPCNINESGLRGTIHSSGWKIGGKSKMKLSADFLLIKQNR
jgi:hypothetical protein